MSVRALPQVSQQFFAIVVDIPKPDLKSCFIAFPFSLLKGLSDQKAAGDQKGRVEEEFPHLVSVIDEAIHQAGLDPDRIDLAQSGEVIMDKITSAIRGASMVIAVCSPEKSTGKPNANVMYELGLASALRKPTLIMTNAPLDLPFDICHIKAFEYSDDQLATNNGRRTLRSQLFGEIRQLRERTIQPPSPPLILDGLKDVWVVKAAHRIVLTRAFWQYARNIFNFANRLSVEGHNVVGDVRRVLSFLWDHPTPPVGTFMDRWNQYSRAHKNSLARFLVRSQQKPIRESLDKLRHESEVCGAQAPVDLLDADYGQLCRNIEDYGKQFALTEQHAILAIQGKETLQDQLRPVDLLEQNLQNLVQSSDRVVRNLVRAMNQYFYTPDSQAPEDVLLEDQDMEEVA